MFTESSFSADLSLVRSIIDRCNQRRAQEKDITAMYAGTEREVRIDQVNSEFNASVSNMMTTIKNSLFEALNELKAKTPDLASDAFLSLCNLVKSTPLPNSSLASICDTYGNNPAAMELLIASCGDCNKPAAAVLQEKLDCIIGLDLEIMKACETMSPVTVSRCGPIKDVIIKVAIAAGYKSFVENNRILIGGIKADVVQAIMFNE